MMNSAVTEVEQVPGGEGGTCLLIDPDGGVLPATTRLDSDQRQPRIHVGQGADSTLIGAQRNDGVDGLRRQSLDSPDQAAGAVVVEYRNGQEVAGLARRLFQPEHGLRGS